MEVNYGDMDNYYRKIDSSSWQIANKMLWRGSNTKGTPTYIKLYAAADGSPSTAYVKIYDLTYGNIICTFNDIVSDRESVISSTNISNISAGEARWEVRGKKSTDDIYWFQLIVGFD
jgi:hypothetical protein